MGKLRGFTIVVLLIVLVDILHFGIDVGIDTKIFWWLIKCSISINTFDSETLLFLDNIGQHSLKSKTTGTQILDNVILFNFSIPILSFRIRIRIELIQNSTDRVHDLIQCCVQFFILTKVNNKALVENLHFSSYFDKSNVNFEPKILSDF